MTSSDDSRSILFVSSPELNMEASPEMYSAFRWDRPAVRRVGMSTVRISAGEGKSESSLKRAMNFDFIDLAAAPETCWAMMPLTRDWNGSTGSEAVGVVKSVHSWREMIEARFGFIERRWLIPGWLEVDNVVVITVSSAPVGSVILTIVVFAVVASSSSSDASNSSSSSMSSFLGLTLEAAFLRVLALAAAFGFAVTFVISLVFVVALAAFVLVDFDFVTLPDFDLGTETGASGVTVVFVRVEIRVDDRTPTAGAFAFRATMVANVLIRMDIPTAKGYRTKEVSFGGFFLVCRA
ncbi:hypothetical protein AA313_de0204953 [Arthrobotrys entomopaga]|nr:hypothetical protein AA313_de0204953 [Arthrobotrys entomopaga]